MKNVLVISSTPRKGGNSEVLAEQFYNGAKSTGNNAEMIYLRDYNLGYCLGCYACTETGKCFQKDGMNELAEKMIKADVIVFATPVYFYSMSGQLKVFIDRLVPVYEDVKADIYLIASQWDSDKTMMDQTFEAIRGCTRDCFEGCTEKGVLYGVSLTELGEAEKNKEYINKAYEMGKNC